MAKRVNSAVTFTKQSKSRNKNSRSLLVYLSDFSTVLVALVLFVFFGLTSTYFFSTANLVNILKQMSVVGVLGVGMTMVILIGGIDLSVGSVVLLSGAITGTLVYNYSFSPWLATTIGLFAGIIVGLINGLFVEKFGISPVIVTLGTMIAVRGLGQAILWINNSWVWVTNPFFITIAEGRILGFPIFAGIMIGLYILAFILLKQTPFGRYIYAIGGNQWAAHLSGVPVQRVKILAYVLCGLAASIAGIMTASRIGVVGPSVGNGMEFDAITAVVLGGTSLSGGIGGVERTFLGTAILVMVLNYMTIRGIPGIWQAAVTGFLILIAVLIDRLIRRRAEV